MPVSFGSVRSSHFLCCPVNDLLSPFIPTHPPFPAQNF